MMLEGLRAFAGTKRDNGMEQLCFLSQETINMTVIIFSNHHCIGVLVK